MFSKIDGEKEALNQALDRHTFASAHYELAKADAKNKAISLISSPKGMLLAFGAGATKEFMSKESKKSYRNMILTHLIRTHLF